MTLITVDAVVDISADVRVTEIRWIIPAVAAGALEYRVIVGVGVAGRAHTVSVPVRRGERRVLRVVERGASPGRRVVAGLARGREELGLCRVSRIRRVVVVGLMASHAGGRQSCEVAVHVAVRALTRWHCV